MSTKVLEVADLKAVETAIGEHTIEFYALAFSKMPDKQGDRIHPKALDVWLKKFYTDGKPLPVSFTHAAVKETSDPFNIIGWADADPSHVWVDDYGLRVRANLETEINPKAEQVYRLTKRGVVTGASVAYTVQREQPQKDRSSLITQMSVMEAGPCLDPANPDAKVLSVKSDEPTQEEPVTETTVSDANVTVSVPMSEWDDLQAKAGRKISAARVAKFRQARDLLDEILAEVDDVSSEESGEKANKEEPQANSEEPNAWLREALAAYSGSTTPA